MIQNPKKTKKSKKIQWTITIVFKFYKQNPKNFPYFYKIARRHNSQHNPHNNRGITFPNIPVFVCKILQNQARREKIPLFTRNHLLKICLIISLITIATFFIVYSIFLPCYDIIFVWKFFIDIVFWVILLAFLRKIVI